MGYDRWRGMPAMVDGKRVLMQAMQFWLGKGNVCGSPCFCSYRDGYGFLRFVPLTGACWKRNQLAPATTLTPWKRGGKRMEPTTKSSFDVVGRHIFLFGLVFFFLSFLTPV